MQKYEPKKEDLSKFSENDELADVQSIELWDDRESSERVTPERVDILDFGDQGFLLKDVLDERECQYFIDFGERVGFQEITQARKSYRNNKRVIIHSEELSDLLWRRISKHVDTITIEGDPHKQHIHGVETLLQGTWKPLNLNPLWRLIRYHPGGHFAPHFDGHIVKSAEVRSLKAFMIYLNGDFQGGTTNFVDEQQELYMDGEGKYCAEEKNVIHSVVPESGLAILFNHHRLHEGKALRSGTKYILRTDILYERVAGPSIDPTEAEALQLAQDAERLEANGDTMEAMRLYRRAFKLSPTLAASYGCAQ